MTGRLLSHEEISDKQFLFPKIISLHPQRFQGWKVQEKTKELLEIDD